jgi:ferrous iron transport protein B
LQIVSGRTIQIALVGNPNGGKSSLFNVLTGLNQKVGNFPGVTVDKRAGFTSIAPNLTAHIFDLPGTYSLYPRREDEWVAYRVLMQQDKQVTPEILVLVADASNLKRNLLFVSQIIDLKMPVVIALTMLDIARQKEIVIDVPELERELGVPIVPVNPRKNKGITQLRKAIEQTANNLYRAPLRDFINNEALAGSAIGSVKTLVQS